jgi:uncharacterized protein YaaR (DUF327 family)
MNFSAPNIPTESPLVSGFEKGQNIFANFQRQKAINLANKLAAIQNNFAPQLSEESLKKAQLQNKMSEAELPYVGTKAYADALYKLGMYNYLNSPTQMVKGLSTFGKSQVEPKLLQSIFQAIQQKTPNTKLNYPSPDEIDKSYELLRQKENLDPNLTKQAKSSQQLYDAISSIDRKPLKEFSGIGGKLKETSEKLKSGAESLNIFDIHPSKDYQDFKSYKNVVKNYVQDLIRKALQTTVQPNYVKENLGKMLYDESMWSSPSQVENNLNYLTDIFKEHAESTTNQALDPLQSFSPKSNKIDSPNLPLNKQALNKLKQAFEGSKEVNTQKQWKENDLRRLKNGDIAQLINGKWVTQ